ncbi:MAG TPA: FmdB family transcriptional regulator [Planctomycetaceae bacterium]|nr:FmdB family transcriptional regulator [Planctomycetaceae bacterium]HQZ67607.1 FmdB family transcriptional regulator [Planctomycetaceae bacterium]
MPTYVYGVFLSEDDETVGKTFEVEQGIKEPPLTHHPQTGQPVRRLLCAPFVAGTWSPLKTKNLLSDKKLTEKGFTKYVRTSSGYEKSAGTGPDRLGTGSGE